MVTAAQKTLVQDTFDSIAPIADGAAALCSIGVLSASALVAAIRSRATQWSEPLEADWRRAMTALVSRRCSAQRSRPRWLPNDWPRSSKGLDV